MSKHHDGTALCGFCQHFIALEVLIEHLRAEHRVDIDESKWAGTLRPVPRVSTGVIPGTDVRYSEDSSTG